MRPSLSALLAASALALAIAPGCTLVFDNGSGGDDDICVAAELAIAPQRNPQTLTCDSFNSCDPQCGPCPLARAPIPTWGSCGSTCEALGEAQCAASPECRVVKDAACAVSGACLTDFIGCFPTDQILDASLDCFAATDGFTCSRSNQCVAYHRSGLATSPQLQREFAMCAPEGVSPGSCAGELRCDAIEPRCPAGHTPGIANGCYTGACIPIDVCALAP